jgi:hypothetical protein
MLSGLFTATEASMRTSLIYAVAFGIASTALTAPPAAAAALRGIAAPPAFEQIESNAEGQKGKKKAKGKEKDSASDRSNASGEIRGKERAQDVQGMQDSGKGAQQRGQRPAK